MSKLDYVTISIVVVCIAAIIFLVVKTSKLMNATPPGIEPNSVEEALSQSQDQGEDIAPFPGEAQTDYAEPAGTGSIDDPDDNEVKPFDPTGEEPFGDEPASKVAETDPAKTNVSPPKSERTNTAVTSPPPASKGGKYMVVAGSFRYKANAEEMVRTLKKLGYDNADVGYTNNGAYAVALVDRFDDVDRARSLVNTLKVKNKIDAIVKTQD